MSRLLHPYATGRILRALEMLALRSTAPALAGRAEVSVPSCVQRVPGATRPTAWTSGGHGLHGGMLMTLMARDVHVSVASFEPPIAASPAAASVDQGTSTSFELVCPICFQQRFSLPGMPRSPQALACPRCARSFTSTPDYVDLTLTSGVKPKVYNQKQWGGTELFRSPVISYIYERGWRQGFSWAGFPGVDKETEMALTYLQPAYGKVVVDMSCGSGLFTRKFARSGKFSGVVAADFSENMLKQAKTFLAEKAPASSTPQAPVLLLRADVGRLPFPTGSVAAIHAGAAIHCWPNPQAALAEIARVLAPGGVFVGTTFMVPSAPLGQVLGNDELVRPFNQLDAGVVRGQYKWWEEEELRDLCTGVGLQNFEREREWRFIMFAARKPVGPQPISSDVE